MANRRRNQLASVKLMLISVVLSFSSIAIARDHNSGGWSSEQIAAAEQNCKEEAAAAACRNEDRGGDFWGEFKERKCRNKMYSKCLRRTHREDTDENLQTTANSPVNAETGQISFTVPPAPLEGGGSVQVEDTSGISCMAQKVPIRIPATAQLGNLDPKTFFEFSITPNESQKLPNSVVNVDCADVPKMPQFNDVDMAGSVAFKCLNGGWEVTGGSCGRPCPAGFTPNGRQCIMQGFGCEECPVGSAGSRCLVSIFYYNSNHGFRIVEHAPLDLICQTYSGGSGDWDGDYFNESTNKFMKHTFPETHVDAYYNQSTVNLFLCNTSDGFGNDWKCRRPGAELRPQAWRLVIENY